MSVWERGRVDQELRERTTGVREIHIRVVDVRVTNFVHDLCAGCDCVYVKVD